MQHMQEIRFRFPSDIAFPLTRRVQNVTMTFCSCTTLVKWTCYIFFNACSNRLDTIDPIPDVIAINFQKNPVATDLKPVLLFQKLLSEIVNKVSTMRKFIIYRNNCVIEL